MPVYGAAADLEPRFLDYAIDNLRVKPSAPAMNHAEAAQLVNA